MNERISLRTHPLVRAFINRHLHCSQGPRGDMPETWEVFKHDDACTHPLENSVTVPPPVDLLTEVEIATALEDATMVLEGRTRSYVTAARVLAIFVRRLIAERGA